MSLEKLISSDLLYLLQRQYPDGITTNAPCPICGTSSRGGGACAKCICSELGRRGAKNWQTGNIRLLFERRNAINHQIALAIEAIQEQIEDKI